MRRQMPPSFRLFNTFRNSSLILSLIFIAIAFAQAQELPKNIRGYKVHNAKVLFSTSRTKPITNNGLTVVMYIDKLEISDISLFGLTIKTTPQITVFKQSGKIDFITFEDFTINGLRVKIQNYNDGFKFKNSKIFRLKSPIKTFVSTSQTLHGAAKEILNSKKEWRVKGRAFIFGRFRKSFLHFKRVIPINIDILIKNPAKL